MVNNTNITTQKHKGTVGEKKKILSKKIFNFDSNNKSKNVNFNIC